MPNLGKNAKFGRFWAKNRNFYGRKEKFWLGLIFIWEKGTLLFTQLFLVVARKWLELRSVFFWARKLARLFAIGPQILSMARV